jgi:hypothetical protein
MDDRAAAYIELAKMYSAGTGIERKAIIDAWDFGAQWKRPDLRRLPCTAGELYPPADRIEAAMLFRAIASGKRFVCELNTDKDELERAKRDGKTLVDYRDELVAIATIYQAALAAGLDGNAMLAKAAAMSPQPVAKFIEGFASRPEGLKSLSAFLLVRAVNADGEIEIRMRGF